MLNRLLALVLLLAAPPALAAGAVFKAGQKVGEAGSAYGHWLPIAIVQKADLVADLPNDSRFEAYASDGKPVPLDLGFAYREFRLLWMPFWAWEEGGWVFFARSPTGEYELTEATYLEREAIARFLKADPTKAYSFSPITHMWGWLALIPLLFAWRAWRRWDDRRREEQGML